MMTEIQTHAPICCPTHGRSVLDLARGRLGDAQAAAAERTRRECPTCRAWWQASLEGEAFAAVDSAVAEAFAGFQAPSRPPRRAGHLPYRWLAAAAILVAILAPLALERPIEEVVAASPKEEMRTASETIFTVNFESGAGQEAFILVGTHGTASPAGETIFDGDFESGSLSGLLPKRSTTSKKPPIRESDPTQTLNLDRS